MACNLLVRSYPALTTTFYTSLHLYLRKGKFMFSQHTSRRDFLFIVCASVSWGTVGVANQCLYSFGATNALSLTFLRLAIATPLFFLASWISLGRRLFHIKRRDLRMMMLMGSMIAISRSVTLLPFPLLE